MLNAITLKTSSIDCSKSEIEILKKILEYARLHFKNGNGAYLAQLNLDNIKFKWCCQMSYLSDLSALKKSSDEMICTNNLTFGAWIPLYFNSIFMVPTFQSNGFINYLKNFNQNYKKIIEFIDKNIQKYLLNQVKLGRSYVFDILFDLQNILDLKTDNQIYFYKNMAEKYIFIKKEQYIYNMNFLQKNNKFIQKCTKFSCAYMNKRFLHKYWIKDYNKFKIFELFISNAFAFPDQLNYFNSDIFLKNDASVISTQDQWLLSMTCCHELYHKWQFSATIFTPIFYIANFFVSLFFGYNNASKNKWLIEGDVRIYVDNNQNRFEFIKLNNILNYIHFLGYIFTIENILKLDEFKNNTVILKDLILAKNKYNLYFYNKFDIETILKQNKKIKDELKEYNFDSLNIDIKSMNQYKFIIKLMKEENILTDEFLNFLEKN